MTAYQISNKCAWIVVTGGFREVQSESTGIAVSGCDITIIVELVYTNDVWSVGGVQNLPTSKNRSVSFHPSRKSDGSSQVETHSQRLQETQSRLQETQSQLLETQTQLQQSNTRLLRHNPSYKNLIQDCK